MRPVAGRQSNLLVVASQTVTPDELKKKLIGEVGKRKLPYGLYFADIEGGFTSVGRGVPNFFEVFPRWCIAFTPMATRSWCAGWI